METSLMIHDIAARTLQSSKDLSKKMLETWEIFTYKHMLFYSVRHLDHRCRLMAWPTGALHSPETTEFKKRQIV
jgi:hypothetical protein